MSHRAENMLKYLRGEKKIDKNADRHHAYLPKDIKKLLGIKKEYRLKWKDKDEKKSTSSR